MYSLHSQMEWGVTVQIVIEMEELEWGYLPSQFGFVQSRVSDYIFCVQNFEFLQNFHSVFHKIRLQNFDLKNKKSCEISIPKCARNMFFFVKSCNIVWSNLLSGIFEKESSVKG